jgi:hypothetical protein
MGTQEGITLGAHPFVRPAGELGFALSFRPQIPAFLNNLAAVSV